MGEGAFCLSRRIVPISEMLKCEQNMLKYYLNLGLGIKGVTNVYKAFSLLIVSAQVLTVVIVIIYHRAHRIPITFHFD